MCNYKKHGNIYIKFTTCELLLDGSVVRGWTVDNCAAAGVGLAVYAYTDYAQYCFEMSDRFFEIADPSAWDFEKYAVRLLSWRPSMRWAGSSAYFGGLASAIPDDVYYY